MVGKLYYKYTDVQTCGGKTQCFLCKAFFFVGLSDEKHVAVHTNDRRCKNSKTFDEREYGNKKKKELN